MWWLLVKMCDECSLNLCSCSEKTQSCVNDKAAVVDSNPVKQWIRSCVRSPTPWQTHIAFDCVHTMSQVTLIQSAIICAWTFIQEHHKCAARLTTVLYTHKVLLLYIIFVCCNVKLSWEDLLNVSWQVWFQAATQLFYSTNLAWGGMITMASYNTFHHNCYRYGVQASVVSCTVWKLVPVGILLYRVIIFDMYTGSCLNCRPWRMKIEGSTTVSQIS